MEFLTVSRICISIFARDYRHACDAIDHHDRAIDLVEVRLDDADPALMEEAARAIPRPLILTCRARDHAGRFPGTEAERIAMLRRAAALKPEYLDVEFGSAAQELIAALPGQAMILSSHPSHSDPATWTESIRAACALNPRLVKFIPRAEAWNDNLAILDALRACSEAAQQLTCFCSGELGLYSRVIAPSRGSAITYCATPGAEPTAPGQFTVDEALRRYRIGSIDRDTRVYGIIGDPVAHSLSPRLHNALFARHGINAVYLPFRVTDVPDFIQFARRARIAGLSVTTPHKQAAAASAEIADTISRQANASNTLVRTDSGFAAHNTDGPAVADLMRETLGLLNGKRIVILGPGGSGCAIAAALACTGASIVLVGREAAASGKIAARLGVESAAQEDIISLARDATINATPLATRDVDPDGFIERLAPKTGFALDLHYSPGRTRFLDIAAANGCVTENGRGMFLRQAARQFAFWTGMNVSLDYLSALLGATE